MFRCDVDGPAYRGDTQLPGEAMQEIFPNGLMWREHFDLALSGAPQH